MAYYVSKAYSQAMAAAGLSAPEAWRAYGSPDLQRGEAAMAVLCENAISLPQQFSLVVFDDITIATYTSPKLTTVRYPIVSMATLATELALRGAAGLLEPQTTHLFMPTLVCRHSVALCAKVRQPSLSEYFMRRNRFQFVRKFTD